MSRLLKEHVQALIQPHGLQILSFINDRETTLLIGHGSQYFWPIFSLSEEYLDGDSNAMDRWSRRIGAQLAKQLDCQVFFPFDGPPYEPFLAMAQANGDSASTPLGMHFHIHHGLWHGYRFGLRLSSDNTSTPKAKAIPLVNQPCSGCHQPCMTTCPVDAFTDQGYEVEKCRSYVTSAPQSLCATKGCLARLACPESPAGGYEEAQHQYHMRAFVNS